MGHTAEVVATRYEVSREEQDRWAVISNQRAAAANESGAFKDQIVPVEAWRPNGNGERETFTFAVDEGPASRHHRGGAGQAATSLQHYGLGHRW